MGKGVALEFKKLFPDMYQDYLRRCAAKEVQLGKPYLFRPLLPPWTLNFPTKDHWRSVSRLSDIIAGLEYLVRHYEEWGITSLATPPLGCGQGQLEWRVVGPILYRHLSRLDIPVDLYAPQGAPQAELDEIFLASETPDPMSQNFPNVSTITNDRDTKVPASWVALVSILALVESQPYHWPVGRVMFQKIAYFATESGIPTGLVYKRGSYGPFADDLKSLVTKLVNNGLLIEEHSNDMFITRVGPTYVDAVRAYRSDLNIWKPTIERIADLFLRMNTKGAEIAATIYFATQELTGVNVEPITETQVLDAVKAWKIRRRPPLRENEIAQTIRSLNLLRWINVEQMHDLPVEDALLLGV